MALKLKYCSVCRRPRLNTREVVIERDGIDVSGHACIECLGSSKEICRAIKKLSQEEQEAVMSYVLENVGRFKK